MPKIADRVQETSTTTGTGTLTLAGAKTGFRSFAAIGDGETCFYVIEHQSASEWETGIGTYTASGTTLSRDEVISSSNAGSAVNFSAGTKNVFVTLPASQVTASPGLNPFRLSLESGVAVSTSDQSAKTTLYAELMPGAGNKLTLYDGSGWREYTASQLSITNSSVTTSKPHDLFVYDNSGTLTLDLTAWTDDSTRATAITLQDGVYVKSGATGRRWLGTVYVDASDQFNDTLARRHVYSANNQVARPLRFTEGTSHTYNGNWRAFNNDSTNRLEWVNGDPKQVSMTVSGNFTSGANIFAIMSGHIDGDGTSADLDGVGGDANDSGDNHAVGGQPTALSVAAGFHYVTASESTYAGGTSTFNRVTITAAMEM